MTALELLLIATSIISWTLYAVAHRRHVRAMRAQAQEHRHAMANEFMCGWFCGLRWTARKRRAAMERQEVTR